MIVTNMSITATRGAYIMLAYRLFIRASLVSGDPGYTLPDHQGVNMVGSFVGLHRLQIAHMTHDRILVHDPVGPQQIPGLAGGLLGPGQHVAFEAGKIGP